MKKKKAKFYGKDIKQLFRKKFKTVMELFNKFYLYNE